MKKPLQLYLHISLWLVYGFLLYLLINNNFDTSDALLKTSVMLIIQISVFYLNSHYLFPKLLISKKTWFYLLNIFVILLILTAFFIWFERQFIADHLNDVMRPRLDGMRERTFRPPPKGRQMLNARVLFQLLSLLFVLIFSSAYAASKIGRKRELIETKSKHESLESEMKFLKSQINPHFLFNALNNIYSLTITGSEKSSEMILKLSTMLRYIIYECNVPFVALEKEWNYITNFIDFQKIKTKEEIDLKLDFSDEAGSTLIAPMIFIPFIENAFKHSNIENTDEGWVHISLNNKPEELIFQVDNSIASEAINKDEIGGIGLENVKRRLELLYNNKFDLIINDNKNSYSVILRIIKS